MAHIDPSRVTPTSQFHVTGVQPITRDTLEFAWYRRDEVVKAVARLERRAAKLGVSFNAQVSAVIVRQVEARDPETGEPLGYQLQWGAVTFDVEPIRFPGWRLIGVLTPMPVSETGTEVKLYPSAVPGETLPSDVRTWASRCDHCQAIRARRDTFILQHEDGSIKQVGRDCIRDFLGTDAGVVLARFNFLRDVVAMRDEYGFSGGAGRELTWRLEHILAVTSAIVRTKGWMSKGRASAMNATPTSSNVDLYMFGRPDEKDAVALRKEVGPVTDEDTAAAARAIDFWLADAGKTDYSLNAKLLAEAGLVIQRAWGLAVSLLPVAQNIGQKQAAERAANAANPSVHVGTIGKREIFEVEVIGYRIFESDFGSKALVTMKDRAGNVIKWWASGNDKFLPEANSGIFKSVKGTVKQHGEYKGKLETTINRVVEA